VVSPGGDIVAGGLFTSIGGLAATHVARWSGSSWSAMGTGFVWNINEVIPLSEGRVAAASQAGVSVWDGSAWQDLNDPLGEKFALAVLPGGNLVAAGFAPSVGHIALWNGSSWSGIGAGISGVVNGTTIDALAVSPRIGGGADVYVGGQFTTAGGAAAIDIAQFRTTTEPPTILVQPAGVSIRCGCPARFFLGATAQGFITYQWRRGGVNLVNGATGAGSTIAGATTPSLTVTNAQFADEGSYDCVLTSGCTSTSTPATLNITTCCDADFNHSGTVSVQDIFDFLAAYFAGC
jgi:hypothetical protein